MPEKKFNKTIIGIICGVVVAAIAVVVVLVIINKNKVPGDDYFVTDDTKIVINDTSISENSIFGSTSYHQVYKYSGDTITDLTTYYVYESEDDAKEALETIFKGVFGFENARVEGKNVIVVADKSDYEYTSTDTVRRIAEYAELGNKEREEEENELEIEE